MPDARKRTVNRARWAAYLADVRDDPEGYHCAFDKLVQLLLEDSDPEAYEWLKRIYNQHGRPPLWTS